MKIAAVALSVLVIGSAGCEKKERSAGPEEARAAPATPVLAEPKPSDPKPSDPKPSDPKSAPADAGAPVADAGTPALALTSTGLGGVGRSTAGTLAAMRAALPGEEIREAEIPAGEGEVSKGFELLRGGRVVAQIVLDDGGAISHIDVSDGYAEDAAKSPNPIRGPGGIGVGAVFGVLRRSGAASQCAVVKTADDQIDDWPDAACLGRDGTIRYEIEMELGASAPTRKGPVKSLRGVVSRMIWFADPKDAAAIMP